MKKPFDTEVKTGELRIFADLGRPVVALIVEDRGAFGFRVVPVSDFTGVSCEGERLVGNRVYQFWNSCSVPRGFAARSWIVDVLSEEEFDSIRTASPVPRPSSLSAYQRACLFSVPGPFARRKRERFPVFRFPFSKAAGFALAACFVLALVFAVRFDLDRTSRRRGTVRTLNLAPPAAVEALESVVEEPEAEAEVAAEVPRFEIAPPESAGLEPEPEIRARVSAPRLAKAVAERAAESSVVTDRYDIAVMRALARKTTDEHAIAVMTYLACGVNAGDAEFGGKLVESTERLVACVRDGSDRGEYTRRLVATALCRAYAATVNPDLKATAEAALDSLGDKRSVDIVARGYDLIEDWYASRQRPSSSASGAVSAPQIDYSDWFRFLNSGRMKPPAKK